MSVNGKGKTPDNRVWVAKTASGERVKVKGKEFSANTYSEAAAAARSHTNRTGEWAGAVTT